ncbi:MAG: ATP-binding protein [Pirellulaceae bacterium]
MTQLIGRNPEQAVLRTALNSADAELVAIYGRRRVGKTFLIREAYRPQLCFELVGSHGASLPQQLRNFATALQSAMKLDIPLAVPGSWQQAFSQLSTFFDRQRGKQKQAVFFDEFPWLASRRSGFLPAFEHFWNTWASQQPWLIVVICGSASAWMIRKVVHHRGGLHNRITRRICLEPFTLAETRQYLSSRGVDPGLRQTLELYMVMGGVPHYLKEIERGRSAAQNIDHICFAQTGLLRDEFDRLYASLFDHFERHVAVIRSLARKRCGMTRNEILNKTGRRTGGGTTQILRELVESGFVKQMLPFEKSRKETVYRLADEYSLFYLKWIERNRAGGAGSWLKKQSGPAWKAWSGYAFENVCIKHAWQLKKALGISGVDTDESSWYYRPANTSESGAQIDLLIERRDDCINLCEMKFSEAEFAIDKRYAAELRNKREVFRRVTNTRKTLFLTMVTTYGVRDNVYRQELIANSIEMNVLFVE